MRNKRQIAGRILAAMAVVASALFGGTGVALAADPVSADSVQRGGVAVYKYDGETLSAIPQGGAALEGTTFRITNISGNEVIYNDEYGHAHKMAVNQSVDIVAKTVTENRGGHNVSVVKAATAANALPYGTYRIQEVKAGPGYGMPSATNILRHNYIPGYMGSEYTQWVASGYTFEIGHEGQVVVFDGRPSANDATPAAYNPPVRGGIEVVKRDHDSLNGTAQGNATLKGAVFEIVNANDHDVVVWDHFDQSEGGKHGVRATTTAKSRGKAGYTDADANGVVKPGGVVATIETGEDGRAHTFMDALPAGFYTVREVKAPTGYLKSENWFANVEISDDDWDTLVATDADDPVIRGAVELQKVDSDFQKPGSPQGDAVLAGATITVVNSSTRPVHIDGRGWVDPKGVVAEAKTDANGYVKVTGLPYGHYTATETAAPDGYAVNKDWKWEFDIKDGDAAGNAVQARATGEKTWIPERLVGENLTITGLKLDGESGKAAAKGKNSLAGAEITLVNESKNDIYYGKKRVKPGEVVATAVTDESGRYTFAGLPSGTYRLHESKAPEGYALNTDWRPVVRLTDKNVALDAAPAQLTDNGHAAGTVDKDGNAAALTDIVDRNDVTFVKRDDQTKQPMAGVAFKVTSKTTGEWHIVVTDANGIAVTATDVSGSDGKAAVGAHAHSHATNANDAAYDEATGTLKEGAALDASAGVWFYGGGDGAVIDSRGALPLDTYTFEELRGSANRGKRLITQTVTLDYANGRVVDLGQIDDPVADYGLGLACDVGNTVDAQTSNSANGKTVKPGSTVTYTIRYRNTGAETASVQLRDYLRDGLTFVSASNGGVRAGEYVEWVIDGVKPGEGGAVTLKAKVDPDADPVIANRVHMGVVRKGAKAGAKGNADPDGRSNIDYISTDGTGAPAGIYAVKSAERDGKALEPGAPVSIGDTITYTVSLTNQGGTVKRSVAVKDLIPWGCEVATAKDDDNYDVPAVSEGGRIDGSSVVWTVGDIKPGETKTVHVTVKVTEKVGAKVSNQAYWGDCCGGTNLASYDNSTNVLENPVKKTPEVTLAKTSDAGGTAVFGQTVTYTIHVANAGHGNATDVRVTDTVPRGTDYVAGSASASTRGVTASVDDNGIITWDIDKVAHDGGSVDLTFSVRVRGTADLSAGDKIANVAKATVGGKTVESNKVTDTVKDASDDVETVKSSTPDEKYPIEAGDEIAYTVTFTNKGTHTAYNYSVFDTVPEHTEFVPGSITVDGTGEGEAEGGTTRTGGLDSSDGKVSTTTWTQVTTVNASDPTAIWNAVVTDAAKQHFAQSDFDTVRRYLSDATRRAGDYIDFEVPCDGWYTSMWRAELLGDGRIALSVRLVVPGQGGSANAAYKGGVMGNYDPSREGVYALVPELAPGQSGTITFKVKVKDDTQTDTRIANVAKYGTASSVAVTPGELIHETNAVHHLVGAYHVIGQKSVDKAAANPGDTLTYTVTLTNVGNATADGAYIADAIPADTSYIDGSATLTGDTGEVVVRDGSVYATGIAIAPSAKATLTFSVLTDGVRPGDTVSNTAAFSVDNKYNIVYGGSEGDTEANTNTATTDILTPADPANDIHAWVTQDPVDGAAVTGGDTVTYTLHVRNDSKGTVKDVRISDAVPEGTEYVDGSVTDGAAYKDGHVTVSFDTLKAGAERTVSYKVKVKVGFAGEVTNDAMWGFGDSTELTHRTNDVDVVAYNPQLTVTLEQTPADGATVARGDTLTYVATVTNTGKVTAHDVSCYGVAPDGTAYVEDSLAGSDGTETHVGKDGLLTVQRPDLAVGESFTMTYRAKVSMDATGRVTNRVMWVSPANTDLDAVHIVSDGTSAETTAVTARMVPLSVIDGARMLAGGVWDVTGNDPDAASGTSDGNKPSGSSNETSSEVVDKDDGAKTVETKPSHGSASEGDVIVDGNLNPTEANVDHKTQDSGESNETTAEVAKAEVELTKSNDSEGAALAAGDTVTYTVTVANKGKGNANGIVVWDDVPEGLTLVKGSAKAEGMTVSEKDGRVIATGDIARDSSATVTFKATVDEDAPASVDNVAEWAQSADGTVPDKAQGSSNKSTVVTDDSKAVFALTLEADREYVKKDETVTYTINVTNTSDKAGSVDVTDTLPDGLTLVGDSLSSGLTATGDKLSAHFDDVEPGGVRTLSFKATVGAAEGAIDDEAAATFDGGTSSDRATVHAEVPTIQVSKTADATEAHIGDTVTYTVTVTNESHVAAHVTVADSMPGGMRAEGDTVSELDLAAGEEASVTFKATVTGDAYGSLVNTVVSTVDGIDGPTSVCEVKVARPALSVSKTVKDGVTAVTAGDKVTYEITVTNGGDATAHNVTVSDKTPEGLVGEFSADPFDLGAGESKTIEAEFTAAEVEGDTAVVNSVTVTDDEGDTADVEAGMLTVRPKAVEPETVKVSKSADRETYSDSGDTVTYTITVEGGEKGLANLTVSDIMPSGLTVMGVKDSRGKEMTSDSISSLNVSIDEGKETMSATDDNGFFDEISSDRDTGEETAKVGVTGVSVDAGETYTLTVTAQVNDKGVGEGLKLVNTAIATADDLDEGRATATVAYQGAGEDAPAANGGTASGAPKAAAATAMPQTGVGIGAGLLVAAGAAMTAWSVTRRRR